MGWFRTASITQGFAKRGAALLALALGTLSAAWAQHDAMDSGILRIRFSEAWEAARRGDHETFRALGTGLEPYELYPYWQYEDYRHRRSRVPPAEMATFLEGHADWAFTEGLRKAWLLGLGEQGRWQALLEYETESSDAELNCYYARARLALGRTEDLLAEAQHLWTAGKSQPDACDPVFQWLIHNGGITTKLAWDRIRLAIESGNPRFTLYLARFLPPDERRWLERWQEFNRNRYRNLERAVSWPDTPSTRMITAVSVSRLSHHDAGAAMRAFDRLDSHFGWDAGTRGDLLREIALMAAVELAPEGFAFMERVPAEHRNGQLLEWRVRLGLAHGAWDQVLDAIDEMAAASSGDDRWRYWRARAWAESGEVRRAEAEWRELAARASFYGFLAADRLGMPYTICPLDPPVSSDQVARLRGRDAFRRAIELRRLGLDNWALAEWELAVRRLPVAELKVAAALAREENWHDRAIFALGDSGDRRYYEWRFPVLWDEPVRSEASRNGLDPAWIFGVMRSESAMTEAAVSPAGAMGLMQVTPGTARQISSTHGLPYQGRSQLLVGPENIRFGSTYLRELLDRFGQNPVVVTGAYNAGPEAVQRWLGSRAIEDPAIWIETLPYYETRDYIPRVLAFTAIYDWRLGQPVRRVSSRMPGIESGNMGPLNTTEVVCRAPQADLAAIIP